ncbi:hypothetical protein M422DRAFT_267457 [Sphaerobolus stellatus SS14]|uniref:Uncharacterized protein n=1 Tax=Sphaerobolus stellatus (strain SS14) TaxID=990650 RepID=A0A0C9U922_SPHS4|nr:hypothetical protein M422DRAFT_267457 [Sphaerobolus stellatus SS14]
MPVYRPSNNQQYQFRRPNSNRGQPQPVGGISMSETALGLVLSAVIRGRTADHYDSAGPSFGGQAYRRDYYNDNYHNFQGGRANCGNRGRSRPTSGVTTTRHPLSESRGSNLPIGEKLPNSKGKVRTNVQEEELPARASWREWPNGWAILQVRMVKWRMERLEGEADTGEIDIFAGLDITGLTQE